MQFHELQCRQCHVIDEKTLAGLERVIKDIPKQTAEYLRNSALKRGSSCNSKDFNACNFQAEGSLEIPQIDASRYSQVYKPVLESSQKVVMVNSTKYSLAGAFKNLPFKEEKNEMHPVTEYFLQTCLARRSSEPCLKLDKEVGYFSRRKRGDKFVAVYGFCDKAAYPATSKVEPGVYRPSTDDIVDGFNSPVQILGAIEEKLNRNKWKKSLAQLAAQMDGFVEAAKVSQGYRYTRFPGLLIYLGNHDNSRSLTAQCLLWSVSPSGHESRKLSTLLTTTEEFCSGVEWWFQECELVLETCSARRQAGESFESIPEGDVPSSEDELAEGGGNKSKTHNTSNKNTVQADSLMPSSTMGTTSLSCALSEERLEAFQSEQILDLERGIDILEWVSGCRAMHKAGILQVK